MNRQPRSELSERIVDTAILLAEKASWESVRLYQIAERLDIGLETIGRCFREKDELIDAWFDRADAAVLTLSGSKGLVRLDVRGRLFTLMMAWLDALESHRGVTRQMILAKLEPGHVHIQIPALMRISRTVQWMREGALLRDVGIGRAVTETATTAIFLGTFVRWMREDQKGSPATRRLLEQLLRQARNLATSFPFGTLGFRPAEGSEPAANQPPQWTP